MPIFWRSHRGHYKRYALYVKTVSVCNSVISAKAWRVLFLLLHSSESLRQCLDVICTCSPCRVSNKSLFCSICSNEPTKFQLPSTWRTTSTMPTTSPWRPRASPRCRSSSCWRRSTSAGTNCIKIFLPGKLILSKRKGLREAIFSWKNYLRINFPGRPIFIQLLPAASSSTRSPCTSPPWSSSSSTSCSASPPCPCSSRRSDRYSTGWPISWWTWIGLTLTWDVPPFCPAAQPLLPNSHQPKQNRADSGAVKIQVTPTQVRQEMDHHVLSLIQTKGVTILLCTESGFRIAKRLKIPILIRIQVQNHNTSIGVMILLFTGSESGSGIANKIKNLTLDPDPGPEWYHL